MGLVAMWICPVLLARASFLFELLSKGQDEFCGLCESQKTTDLVGRESDTGLSILQCNRLSSRVAQLNV